MFANAAPQHRRRNIPATAFLLGFVKDMQHDALLVGESVANVRDVGIAPEEPGTPTFPAALLLIPH